MERYTLLDSWPRDDSIPECAFRPDQKTATLPQKKQENQTSGEGEQNRKAEGQLGIREEEDLIGGSGRIAARTTRSLLRIDAGVVADEHGWELRRIPDIR